MHLSSLIKILEQITWFLFILGTSSTQLRGRLTMQTSSELTTGYVPDPLNFTDSAVSKVRELIEDEGNTGLMLRVYISGGGCSGFQYGFTFDEKTTDGDTVIEREGVKLLVDPMSIQYLAGAEIDYSEGLEGAQFVIRNPNARTTCGCGSSFSV
jgi:iron-sulfur cluster insertion protein